MMIGTNGHMQNSVKNAHRHLMTCAELFDYEYWMSYTTDDILNKKQETGGKYKGRVDQLSNNFTESLAARCASLLFGEDLYGYRANGKGVPDVTLVNKRGHSYRAEIKGVNNKDRFTEDKEPDLIADFICIMDYYNWFLCVGNIRIIVLSNAYEYAKLLRAVSVTRDRMPLDIYRFLEAVEPAKSMGHLVDFECTFTELMDCARKEDQPLPPIAGAVRLPPIRCM